MNTTKIIKLYRFHFKNKKVKRLFLLFFFFANLSSSFCQSNVLKGKVINETGEPVQFASISIKGTGSVVATDSKGRFILRQVPAKATLVISCIGYKTKEYVVSDSSVMVVISLETDTKRLQEVEVMSNGYQYIPKERATGAFVKIDNTMFSQQAGTNVLSRLDGITSGLLMNTGKRNLNPQNKTNISIRGLSTINGPLDPLIVLDGFIYEGNIENINPFDVDNVTVLKDAAATSIWGTRAGNGVIVINTKKGHFDQKMKVSVTADIIASQKPDLYYLPQMSSSDYIDVEQFLFNQGYFNNTISRPYQPLTPAVEIFLDRKNNLITSSDSSREINSLKNEDIRRQYNKYFYRNPVTRQYFVSLMGGGNKNTYKFSVGYDNTIGKTFSAFNKLNIKVENSFKPIKNILINIGAYYTDSRSLSGRPSYNSITIGGRQVPYLQFADASGNPKAVSTTYNNKYIDTAGAGKLLDWKFYPLEDYKHLTTSSNLQEIYAYTGIKYSITPFINIDFQYQYQRQATTTEQLSDLESFSARNTINLFSQLNRNTGVVKYIVPLGGIRSMANSYVQSHTIRGQLNINKNWPHHSLNAILGSEMREVSTNNEGSTVFGYYEDPLTYSNIDQANYYQTFITGNSQYIPYSPSFSEIINRFVSIYANASYTIRGKYILSGSARRDGSNIFGLNTNEKWKPLWSVGGAWNISKEQFYNCKLFPVLKIRATYGYSGNVDLSKSAVAVARYFSASSATNLPYARVTTLNNPDLRWESTRMLNIGIDFSTKENILSGSIDLYNKSGKDLYGDAVYDYTTWGYLPTLTRNVAEMKGKGVDIILNSKNLDKNFKWNTMLLLNYNSDKTTKYDDAEAKNIGTKLGDGTKISPFIGRPLYSIAAYKWGGLDNDGNPRGYLDGKLSTDYQSIFEEAQSKGTKAGNIRYIGSATPLIFGSLINNFSAGKFSLSFNISYRFNYYFQKTSIAYSSLVSSGIGNKDYEKRWQKPGDEKTTNIPSFIYPVNSNRDNFYLNSEVNVLKADNVKLQYINLTYSLGKSILNKFHLDQLQFYINASNLGILWISNKENLDPDYPSSIRPSKTISFGLRANL